MPNSYCLIPSQAEKFKQEMINGNINPEELSLMTSAERREVFAKIIGEENAKNVNALFESKLLLKNQQAGMIAWAKKVVGISKAVRQDLISKIERLDEVLTPENQEAFLEDLISKRLGTDITYEEAAKIAELSKTANEAKVAIKESSPIGSEDRLAYGNAIQDLNDYVNGLKEENNKVTLEEFKANPVGTVIKETGKVIANIPGTLKSVLASLDNSFFGRQGIKTLYTNPDIWAKAFAKSWVDGAKQLVAEGKWYKSGEDVALRAIKADIYSRPNALNGKYQAGGFGLSTPTEEAFPTSIPEKIPLFGRLFKASEAMYNGAALRIRADLADRVIKQAEDFGLDMLDKEEAKPIGQGVSSLTGRGSLGEFETVGKKINSVAFSIKFVKANIDTLFNGMTYVPKEVLSKLGMYEFESKGAEFASKKAATNLLKIIGGMAAILTIAEILNPGSVEKDPRSSNFGKIKIGSTTIDISGGLGGLVTLATRLMPTKHDGQWGFWSKNATTGVYTDLTSGKYGQQTALDVANSFWEGKLSPTAGILRDVWEGKNYKGEKPTIKNVIKGAITPLPFQTGQDLLNKPDAAPFLAGMILDGLGFSANTQKPPKKK